MLILKKRRVVSLALVMLMVFSCISSFLINVSAEDFTQNNLSNSHKNIYAADNFTGLDESELYNHTILMLMTMMQITLFGILLIQANKVLMHYSLLKIQMEKVLLGV